MAGEARAGCTVKGQKFLGDSPRGARVAVLPDFVRPADDGFYVCAMAQSTGPNNQSFVTRTTSMKGAAKALGIECVASPASGGLAYVPCTQPHNSEYAGTYTVTPLGAPYDGTQLQDRRAQRLQADRQGVHGPEVRCQPNRRHLRVRRANLIEHLARQ